MLLMGNTLWGWGGPPSERKARRYLISVRFCLGYASASIAFGMADRCREVRRTFYPKRIDILQLQGCCGGGAL